MMWTSPESEHTCHGKIRGWSRCERCYWSIEPGQRYRRYVMRFGDKGARLHAFYEHVDGKDCPEEEIDQIFAKQMAREPVSATIQVVARSVEVIALDTEGNAFTETSVEFAPEIVETSAHDESHDYIDSYEDDDIPF